jgi:hypothetical protein
MAQERKYANGAERTRAWRERRRAELARARSQGGQQRVVSELDELEALEADRHAAIMASIRRLRIAIEAVESRIGPAVDEGVAATYPAPDDQQMPASGQEMDVDSAPDVQQPVEVKPSLASPRTAGELLILAAGSGIAPDVVEATTLRLCGPLTGAERTADELERVWIALQAGEPTPPVDPPAPTSPGLGSVVEPLAELFGQSTGTPPGHEIDDKDDFWDAPEGTF